MKTKTRTKISRSQSFAAGVGRALRRAAKDARKTARMFGTPLYVWEDGKVVAKKPCDALLCQVTCRAQIGCAVTVPWCDWDEGWLALQAIDLLRP